ncbi:MAG: DNA-invertase hin [Holosporales bacterium]
MKFGYARVSKNDQSLEVQIKKLKMAGCDEIFKEKISGVKEDRSELKKLTDKLRSGDTIYVVRLDRLGRKMLQLVELINYFKENGINFVSLENNIDTTTPLGMVLFSMCAAFSEMERELIKERVKAGVEAAHAKGRRGGRPKALTEEKENMLVSLLTSDQFSVTQICQIVGITRSVYYRFLKSYNDREQK